MRNAACLALLLVLLGSAAVDAQSRHRSGSSASPPSTPPSTPGFGPNTGFGINSGFGPNTGFGPTTGFGRNTGLGPPVRSKPDEELYGLCIGSGFARETCEYLATHGK